MFSMKPRSVLQGAISLAALSVLVACGGGGDGNASSPVSTSPTPPTNPSPPTNPTPPTNPPPSDPAPPVDITLAPGYTDIKSTVTFSQNYWPDWNHAGSAPIDGVVCGPVIRYHIHAMVSIYKDGQRLALPGNIGRPNACDYEMHTHDGSGVVHIETDKERNFTLAQFFAEWGQPLSAASIADLPGAPTFYVIDKEQVTRFTGDPATLELAAHREIVIVTGTQPAQVPRYDWNSSGL
jgi:hypothetical protein